MILLTYEENKSYKKKNICCMCKKEFSTDDDDKKYHKVRDHCHYTGKYRGARKINWETIWMLKRKCREIYLFFCANLKKL